LEELYDKTYTLAGNYEIKRLNSPVQLTVNHIGMDDYTLVRPFDDNCGAVRTQTATAVITPLSHWATTRDYSLFMQQSISMASFSAASILDPLRANGSAANISFAISSFVRSLPSDFTQSRRVCNSLLEYSEMEFLTGIGGLAGFLTEAAVVCLDKSDSVAMEVLCNGLSV